MKDSGGRNIGESSPEGSMCSEGSLKRDCVMQGLINHFASHCEEKDSSVWNLCLTLVEENKHFIWDSVRCRRMFLLGA